MTATPSRERSTGAEPDPPPENELAIFLWVVVGLLGILELAWAFFDRMYSP